MALKSTATVSRTQAGRPKSAPGAIQPAIVCRSCLMPLLNVAAHMSLLCCASMACRHDCVAAAGARPVSGLMLLGRISI